ncbi:MAG: aspartate aminotransferase family protein [Candidatus Atribacteria bacterium]|nr:aspartate aminotransferase family protein [Candidatus Atribacteria bacterium]
MNSEQIIQMENENMLATYSRLPIVIKTGKGCLVYDPEGKSYLDFVAGIAVNLLGYGYQPLIQAIIEQAQELIHASNLYYTLPQTQLAKDLTRISGFDRVFFNNSGAEANEIALKMARFYGRRIHGNRYKFITFSRSFHGRTFLTLTATAQEKFHHDLEPLVGGMSYAELNQIESVMKVIDDETCGIIVEPIQGEGGVFCSESSFLHQIREVCNERDIILIFDEVQCGMGRTGKFFAFETYGVKPDIVTLAKGLGGGLPIGAVLVNEKIVNITRKGDQGSTFGGNPVCTKAAQVVVNTIAQADFLKNVVETGEYLQQQLHQTQKKFSDLIQEVRGMGLMWGLQVPGKAKFIVEKMLEKGVIVNAANDDVLRLLPPLIVGKKEINQMVHSLEEVLLDIQFTNTVPGID